MGNNYPMRTGDEAARLKKSGFFPFPELTVEENDEIFVARLSGFAAFYPAVPTAKRQAENTLRGAREHNSRK